MSEVNPIIAGYAERIGAALASALLRTCVELHNSTGAVSDQRVDEAVEAGVTAATTALKSQAKAKNKPAAPKSLKAAPAAPQTPEAPQEDMFPADGTDAGWTDPDTDGAGGATDFGTDFDQSALGDFTEPGDAFAADAAGTEDFGSGDAEMTAEDMEEGPYIIRAGSTGHFLDTSTGTWKIKGKRAAKEAVHVSYSASYAENPVTGTGGEGGYVVVCDLSQPEPPAGQIDKGFWVVRASDLEVGSLA